MIVDSSTLIAILLREPDAEALATALLAAPVRRMSAANYLEAAIVADARARPTSRLDAFDELISRAGIEVAPVTREQAESARDAYRRFGRGHHPARLNFGDCFAYALSKESGEPLLFKGEDFALTDVKRAL